VLTTSNADHPPERLDASVTGWLRKPFTLAELLVEVTAAAQELKRIRCNDSVASAAMTREDSRQIGDGQKPVVLVVDDDEAVRNLLCVALGRHGFEVCPAASGMEALNLCRKQAPALSAALLDVRMPGLDGPQTMKALRRLLPGLPCCFMTGNPGAYGLTGLLDRGAAAVITKPFCPSEVAATLWRIVERGARKATVPAERQAVTAAAAAIGT
jgi:CheY-like chemotaxis protein